MAHMTIPGLRAPTRAHGCNFRKAIPLKNSPLVVGANLPGSPISISQDIEAETR